MVGVGKGEGVGGFDEGMRGCEDEIMVFRGNELKVEGMIRIERGKSEGGMGEEN